MKLVISYQDWAALRADGHQDRLIKERGFMISRIEEIRKALDNNLPEAALALALTLPDICGQIEFPSEGKVGKRYVNWLDGHIPKDAFDVNYDGVLTALNNGVDPKFSRLTPTAIYKLRCHFLHSGDTEIENDDKDAYMDEFILQEIGAQDWRDENGLGASSGYTSYQETDENGKETRTYVIDVKYLCEVLYQAAEKYYNNHNKALFDDHTVHFMKKGAR